MSATFLVRNVKGSQDRVETVEELAPLETAHSAGSL